jgi:hypothetical protein
VIAKVLRSGGSTKGLVRYLFGAGERNEHQAPRLVAGWDALDRIAPDLAQGDTVLRGLAGLLDAPNKAAGGGDGSIYHLILSSARPDPMKGLGADPALSDEQWAGIARDVLERIGVISGGDQDGVRWVAVRHDQAGAEHIHVVATLASQQSHRRVHPRNDFYRLGEGCRAAESRHGLRPTAPRDRTSTPPPGRQEREKAARLGRPEPARDVLRRQVREAAGRASSSLGFLDELRGAGLLVRERLSPGTGDLTGYSVALAGGDRDSAGEPIFYGGGRLASDLTLPKVRARFGEAVADRPLRAAADPGTPPRGRATAVGPAPRLSAPEREQVWQQAQYAAEQATRVISGHAQDPAAAADAAWAASDFLAGAARLVAGDGRAGPLEQAARDLDRAAREQWGRVPGPSQAGQGLRAASGLLLAARFVQSAEASRLLALLAQVAALADSVSRMREAQGRAAQAAAARRASEALQAAYSARSGTAQLAQAAAAVRSLDGITQQQPWGTGHGRIR